jgi:hypothetical protein
VSVSCLCLVMILILISCDSPFTAEIYAEKAKRDAKKDASKPQTRSSGGKKKA